MFKAVIETDKYGKSQTHYYLTQGDSCTIYSTPYKDGEKLSIDAVEKCLFKLSNSEYEQEFEKELVAENDKFVLRLTHDETQNFEIAKHIYEIEYTLVGGAVQTPNQYTFEIIDQIQN